MRINNNVSDKETSNVETFDFIEKLIQKNGFSLTEKEESKLKSLKIKAGVLLDSEINYHGIKDGLYLFEQKISNGTSKLFYCNPDDAEFYMMCIPKAIEMDKNERLRERRLEEFQKKCENVQKEAEILSPEQAIRNINNNNSHYR